MGSSVLFYTINTIQLIMYSEFLKTRLQILFFIEVCTICCALDLTDLDAIKPIRCCQQFQGDASSLFIFVGTHVNFITSRWNTKHIDFISTL